MNATIYSHRTIIGTADLQVGNEGMGCLFGQFIPNDNYFKDIQKIVWEFWKTNKMDYDKWLSFRFNARLDNGFFLFPYGGYTFDDSPEFPDEPKRIDIAGIDLEILNFNSETLLEPWYTIDLERKIYYEDELLREITPPNSFFSFIGLGKKKNHTLFGAEISAFAKFGLNDDVLFQVKKKGNQNQFATVHLTFSKNENIQPSIYPATHFFIDFQDFAEKRMKPDNQEWNG